MTNGRDIVKSRRERVAGLLDRAATLVSRNWFQGQYWPNAVQYNTPYTEGGPCCAMGAIAVAAGVTDPNHAGDALDHRADLRMAVRAVAAELPGRANPAGDRWEAIATWNDHADRTADQVAAVLRAAARQLRNTAAASVRSAVPGGPSAKTFHQAGLTSSTREHTTSEVPAHV